MPCLGEPSPVSPPGTIESRLLPAGVALAWLSPVLLATGVALSSAPALLLGTCAGLLLVVARWAGRDALRGIDAERALPPRAIAGRAVTVRARLRKRSRGLSASHLRLRDGFSPSSGDNARLPFLARGGAAEFSYPLRFLRRGRHRGDSFRLASCWPFGIFEHTLGTRFLDWSKGMDSGKPESASILVAPRPLPPGSLLRGMDQLARSEPSRSRPVPAHPDHEFRALREFRTGDSPRAVHWPASTRTARLMVRESEPPRPPPPFSGLLLHQHSSAGTLIRPQHFEILLRMGTGLLLGWRKEGTPAVFAIAAEGRPPCLLARNADFAACLDQLATAAPEPGPIPALQDWLDEHGAALASCDHLHVLGPAPREDWEETVRAAFPGRVCLCSSPENMANPEAGLATKSAKRGNDEKNGRQGKGTNLTGIAPPPGGGPFWTAASGAALLAWTGLANGHALLLPWLASLPLALLFAFEWHRARRPAGKCAPLSFLANFATRAATAAATALLLGALALLAGAANTGLEHLRSRPADGSDSPGDLPLASEPAPASDRADGASRLLPRRADISFTGRIRFHLRVDSPGAWRQLMSRPLYLRTHTLARFDSDDHLSPLLRNTLLLDSDDGESDGSTAIRRPADGRPLSYSLFLPRREIDRLPLLAETHRLHAPTVEELAPDWYRVLAEESLDWIQVRAEAMIRSGTAGRTIRPAAGASLDDFLQLPATQLNARISHLAERIAGSTPRDLQPRRIADFLTNNHDYALRYGNPGDLPPLENFLFGEKTGHCELYAASATAMLRSLGIPARIAYGYRGGDADPGSGTLAFRDRHFHAWPEILTEDEGWRILDPTPSLPGDSALPDRTQLVPPDFSLYTDLASDDDEPGRWPPAFALAGWGENLVFRAARNLPALFAAALLLAGLAWWGKNVLRNRRTRHGESSGAPPSLPDSTIRPLPGRRDLAKALLKLGESLGLRRHPAETLGEFVERLLGAAPPASAAPLLREAVDYHYRIHYTAAPPDRAREKKLIKELRALRRVVRGHAAGLLAP